MKNLLLNSRAWLDVAMEPELPETGSFSWIFVVIAIILVCVVVFVIVNKNKKNKIATPEQTAEAASAPEEK